MSHARIPITTLSIPITFDSIRYRRWKINGRKVTGRWKIGGKEVENGSKPVKPTPPAHPKQTCAHASHDGAAALANVPRQAKGSGPPAESRSGLASSRKREPAGSPHSPPEARRPEGPRGRRRAPRAAKAQRAGAPRLRLRAQRRRPRSARQGAHPRPSRPMREARWAGEAEGAPTAASGRCRPLHGRRRGRAAWLTGWRAGCLSG
jgi:hypothetical protein